MNWIGYLFFGICIYLHTTQCSTVGPLHITFFSLKLAITQICVIYLGMPSKKRAIKMLCADFFFVSVSSHIHIWPWSSSLSHLNLIILENSKFFSNNFPTVLSFFLIIFKLSKFFVYNFVIICSDRMTRETTLC